jgi:cation diffusion facilitator family transporter
VSVSAGVTAEAPQGLKRRTAAVSIVSNSTLILLKVIAGTITGSVAILTEAVHSSIDLVASVVAFFSVRKADEPADESHRYGHEKIENLSAAIEGILILSARA